MGHDQNCWFQISGLETTPTPYTSFPSIAPNAIWVRGSPWESLYASEQVRTKESDCCINGMTSASKFWDSLREIQLALNVPLA